MARRNRFHGTREGLIDLLEIRDRGSAHPDLLLEMTEFLSRLRDIHVVPTHGCGFVTFAFGYSEWVVGLEQRISGAGGVELEWTQLFERLHGGAYFVDLEMTWIAGDRTCSMGVFDSSHLFLGGFDHMIGEIRALFTDVVRSEWAPGWGD